MDCISLSTINVTYPLYLCVKFLTQFFWLKKICRYALNCLLLNCIVNKWKCRQIDTTLYLYRKRYYCFSIIKVTSLFITFFIRNPLIWRTISINLVYKSFEAWMSFWCKEILTKPLRDYLIFYLGLFMVMARTIGLSYC